MAKAGAKNEEVLFWLAVIVALLLLLFGRRGNTTYVENGDIMGPQLGGFPALTILNPDYQLGNVTIDRAMVFPPRGSCGCADGCGAPLNPSTIINYVFPPIPQVPTVTRDPFVPVVPRQPPPTPRIEVYKDANYQSKRLVFHTAVSNMNTTGLGLNDGISSMRVTGQWEVFEDAYFQGQSRVVSGDISNLAGTYFQDRISSMRPL